MGQDFKSLADEMDRVKLSAPVISSVVMVGRSAFAIPASVSSQTFLSYPSVLPNETNFAEFLSVMRKGGVEVRSPAFQSMAFAATKILFEATKLSSRQIDRAGLVSSLERMHDFKTGVLPPVTFGPNRRVGSVSSYMVGVDVSKQQYVPLTERLAPKEKP